MRIDSCIKDLGGFDNDENVKVSNDFILYSDPFRFR